VSAIESPIKPRGPGASSSEPAAHGELALSRALARCRPAAIRAGTTGADVIANAIDASGTRRRVYTATDGEGLLRMAPSLFRAAELELPIVMTVLSTADRRDHGHAMALRDCGWIQLYPSDDQDAVDTHIQAFRIAESLSLPVMVCMDAFTRPPTTGPPQVPSSDEIEAFLRGGESRPRARSGSDRLAVDMQMELRYLAHNRQGDALGMIRQVAADFRALFGRQSGGALLAHRICAAKLAVLGLGSTFEAITVTVDELRGEGVDVGAVALHAFRPFPARDVAAALLSCERVVIVERALAVGVGGIVSADVRSALSHRPVETHTVIAGLGNRSISPEALRSVVYRAARGSLEELGFLDVRRELVRDGTVGVGA
jgi:pyruvate ferredoxin oxidoreductase alpha subunit